MHVAKCFSLFTCQMHYEYVHSTLFLLVRKVKTKKSWKCIKIISFWKWENSKFSCFFSFTEIEHVSERGIGEGSLVHHRSGDLPVCVRDLQLCILCDPDDDHNRSLRPHRTQTEATSRGLRKQQPGTERGASQHFCSTFPKSCHSYAR